jgi:hypothetical protein
LRGDFTQEELRIGSSHASQPKVEDAENLAQQAREKPERKRALVGVGPQRVKRERI